VVTDATPTVWPVVTRNVALMHLLERLARRFNDAGVPFMVLKGAALQLTLYRRPDERPMGDIDLLVRPGDVDKAVQLLLAAGCRRGAPLVREDFFPCHYYEAEFLAGDVFPLKIDLHVRPFRPLRYARTVPDGAFWDRARPVRIGRATVLVPSPEDMLIHLATHLAVHGFARPTWRKEIKLWAEAQRDQLDWDRLAPAAAAWGLALPVRRAIERVEGEFGEFCPADARRRLAETPVSWRDRVALWHAPRDERHPVGHVLVNALCTPGWRFVAGYLFAVLVPTRPHLEQWYARRHPGWLVCAHAARWLGPPLNALVHAVGLAAMATRRAWRGRRTWALVRPV